MDVAEQVCKHLPRTPEPTIPLVDQYCTYYQDLFPDVRSYENFKLLHLGIISNLKRKSLPELERVVRVSSQSLHHFLSQSLWSLSPLEQRRLNKLVTILQEEKIILVVDETGDKKKEKNEIRYIREIIYGKKGRITYWEMTTDTETLPVNSSSFVMTNCQGNLKKRLGNLSGQRTWIEYGFRQCKQELGWKDYRLTKIESIEKWWSIINSVYTMISLQTKPFRKLLFSEKEKKEEEEKIEEKDQINTWKKSLKKIMMMIEPLILFWLIKPWLKIANSSLLLEGFNNLLSIAHSSGLYFPKG